MVNLILLHEDALTYTHPVFHAAGEGAIPFFIWDDNYLQKMDYSFKRLVFIYETLCEMKLTVYRGTYNDIIPVLANDVKAERLYIPFTPNPLLENMAGSWNNTLDIVIIKPEPFTQLDDSKTYMRFFQYWKKVSSQLLR